MAVFSGQYDGLRVFTSTMQADREGMGARVTEWIAGNKGAIFVVGTEVLQSSDNAFHCISITVFYTGREKVVAPSLSKDRR